MGKCCLHACSFIFDRIIIEVAGNQDRHKSSVEFAFGPNQTTHFGATCTWVTKKKKKKKKIFSIAIWSKTFSRIWDSPSSGNDLRNKFHFSGVHESMNTKGHEQSKWRLKGVMLTLHVIRCVHTCTSMNLRKTKFISYITLNAIILRPLAEVSFKRIWRREANIINRLGNPG